MQAASLRFEDTETARRRNRPLLERALALDPQSGAVLFAQAMWDDIDDETRESIFRAAARRDPDNSRGLTSFAGFLDLISNTGSPASCAGPDSSRRTTVRQRRAAMLATSRRPDCSSARSRSIPCPQSARFFQSDPRDPAARRPNRAAGTVDRRSRLTTRHCTAWPSIDGCSTTARRRPLR